MPQLEPCNRFRGRVKFYEEGGVVRLTLTSKNVEPNRGQRARVSESKQNSCKLSADHSESSKKETIIAAESCCVYSLCCAGCDCDC